MNKIIILITLGVLLFNCSNSERQSKKPAQPAFIIPVTTNENDTISNGSTFVTKAFLSNDSLYKVAQANGIEDYLRISFEDSINYQNISWPSHRASLNGDTGIIEFNVSLDTLTDNQIARFDWLLMIDVTFKKGSTRYDTGFLDTVQFYVKNKNLR